jgi:hypothetical protein
MVRLLRTLDVVEESRAVVYGFLRECLLHREIEALIHMCEAPYWKRTWILQEAALARKIRIIWGDYRLPSDILSGLADLVHSASTQYPEFQKG